MAKHIIKEFLAKKSATDAVFTSLQEKLTAALARERVLVAKNLVMEDGPAAVARFCKGCGNRGASYRSKQDDVLCDQCAKMSFPEPKYLGQHKVIGGVDHYLMKHPSGSTMWVTIPPSNNEATEKRAFRITFKPNKNSSRELSWTRFAVSFDDARRDAIKALKGEYPDAVLVDIRETKNVNETRMPISDVQRVFDETGDIGETELLCGITQLKVVNGQVLSYISEGLNRYNEQIQQEAFREPTRIEICSACGGNGWNNGVKLSSICERCAGSGKRAVYESELTEDIADELAAKYQPDPRARFKVGDKVKESDSALERDRMYVLGLGRSHPRYSASMEHLKKRAAKRGVVAAAGTNGYAVGVVVRWDNGTTSEAMQHMVMLASERRLNGLE